MIPKLNDLNLFPRKIVSGIAKYLETKGVILLVGARQVGKTSILYLLIDELKKRRVSENSIHYFDLEDLTVLGIFNSGVKEFIAYLKAIGVDLEKRNYLFIDEIQYMDNPTNFLKIISDHHSTLKLIVSGSSTLEIRRKFKDSLAGRKVVFEVFSLDFHEFLLFKKEEKLAAALTESDWRHINRNTEIQNLPVRFFMEDMARYFNEYLIFGGYPRVALEKENEKRITYLMDIYNSYVKKDIKDIMRVDNVTAFNNLIRVLALQIGNLVNVTELCNTVKIARETMERYLFLLENTFIIKMITPFSSNPRKEISKMGKLYFMDTGLRNTITKNLNNLDERVDAGALVENGVFSNMMKNLSSVEEIHYWRTLSGNEVDFVLIKGNFPKPIEVKYSSFKFPRIPSGIRTFQKDYKVPEGIILTKDYFAKDNKAAFIPIWLC
jgi:predicted AAA+ superfamily ATPase